MLGDEWLKLDSQALYREFDHWISEVSATPYWSPKNPDGQRIHWESFKTARNHSSRKPEFAQAGCYLWAWGSGIENVKPRYVGETGNTFRSRLERYTGPPNTQKGRSSWCRLAADHEDLMRSGRWMDLPSSILVPYYKAFGSASVKSRIKVLEQDDESIDQVADFIRRNSKPTVGMRVGAPDFARLGVCQIWFALIPIACEERVQGIKATVPREIWEKGEVKRIRKEAAVKLQGSLIIVVNQWNQNHGRPLLQNQRGA